jgi:hypothetical protein
MSFWGTLATAAVTSGPSSGFRTPTTGGILVGLAVGVVIGSFMRHFSGKDSAFPAVVATSALALGALALFVSQYPKRNNTDVALTNNAQKNTGTIYVLNQSGSNLYKIGMTKKDGESRIKSLQTGNPQNIVVAQEYKAPLEYEKKLHKLFSHKNVRGEWFEFTPNDLQIINLLMQTNALSEF